MESRLMELRSTDSTAVLKALASETRMQILGLLAEEPRNINSLGQMLGVSQPSITKHVQLLAHAGLITTQYSQGTQGLQKVCSLRYNRLTVVFDAPQSIEDRVEEISMPLGLYTNIEAAPTCGLASRDRIIDFLDEPQAFFHPDRSSAQLLWTSGGFVEYVFPNTLPTSMAVNRLELSMEICSEVPDYDMDHPSDITLWINGMEVGTWCSPGDMGGKRGRLNPPWWSEHFTQFGLLKVWSVDKDGTSVDGTTVSDVTLDRIGLQPLRPIRVRIGVKPDAEHAGGFNIFGQGFGNYEQDLVLRLHYATRARSADPGPDTERQAEPDGERPVPQEAAPIGRKSRPLQRARPVRLLAAMPEALPSGEPTPA